MPKMPSPGRGTGRSRQRFPRAGSPPSPVVTTARARGLISAETRHDVWRGQPGRWTALWTTWGAVRGLLWTPVGKACEFRGCRRGNGPLRWPAVAHRLWITVLFRVVVRRAVLARCAFRVFRARCAFGTERVRGTGLQLGHVQFVLARYEGAGVVE